MNEHMTAKKKRLSRWIPHNMSIAEKQAHVDWWREMLKSMIKMLHIYEHLQTTIKYVVIKDSLFVFRKIEHVATVPIEERKALNFEWRTQLLVSSCVSKNKDK